MALKSYSTVLALGQIREKKFSSSALGKGAGNYVSHDFSPREKWRFTFPACFQAGKFREIQKPRLFRKGSSGVYVSLDLSPGERGGLRFPRVFKRGNSERY